MSINQSKKLSFSTKFCDYELIQTEDESWAIYSEFYQENSHSIAGAKSETLHNFINGCKLNNKLNENDEVRLLEVGFGIGNGFATTYEFWKSNITKAKLLQFDSLEIDPELVEYAMEQGPYAEDLKGFHRNDKYNWSLEEDGRRIELNIIAGDARDTINSLPKDYYHIVYQDAYSPSKNRELWTFEWFKLLYQSSLQGCLMGTYSASARIRKAMAEAGWQVYDQKGFKNKRSMTIAKKTTSDENSMNEKLLNNKVDSLKDDDLKE